MKKMLVTLFLTALAGNALAAWTEINKNERGTVYADRSTIRRSAGTIKMWSLTDYSQPKPFTKGRSYSSSMMLEEHDCQEQRTRLLQVTLYSEQMREGALVHTESTPFEWTYVQPDSVGEALLKFACQK
jgi:hypothetical protein